MLRILILSVIGVATTKASDGIGYGDSALYPIQPKLISESVKLNELPTKVIKITKTVAVKIPVPYPVKIPHHIPIPVPVHHPIGIPVPQVVKVQQHVPVPIDRPVPVNLPVYLQVPHSLPHHHHHLHQQQQQHPHDIHASLFAGRQPEYEAGEAAGSEQESLHQQQFAPSQHFDHQFFRPSQPDYANAH